MALCKNPKCMATLGEYQWGGGYCSARCMKAAPDYDKDQDAPLLDPNDPTGHTEICRNLDEVDAMLEAAAIDPRLPRIIYLRKKRFTFRKIGRLMEPKISDQTCRRILQSVAPNLLRDCGLRKI